LHTNFFAAFTSSIFLSKFSGTRLASSGTVSTPADSNSKLYMSLQDPRPQGFASQEFVQDSKNCTPLYCQISWAGIAFNNADMALMAFDLLDKEIRPTELINQINLAWDQTLIEKLKAIP